MKKFLFTGFIFLTTLNFSFSQQAEKPPYPKSFADIGIGLGPNYGIFGVKTVIGYKGSGLMVGLGKLEGFLAYEIGLQGSIKWWFVNVGYGVYGVATTEFYYYYGQTEKTSLLKGIIINTGGKINLIRSKNLFLELGIGYGQGGYIEDDFIGYRENINAVNFVAGLNYRISSNIKK